MASPTRRTLLQGSLAAGLSLSLAGPRSLRAQPPVTATPLSDRLHILTADGLNILARTDSEGLLLVDGGSTATSAALLDTATALGGGAPVHTLFNTHWHPEHTGSNLAASAMGARIIAQENTRLWLTTDIVYPWDETQRFDPLPQAAQPNSSFYDTGELPSGIRYGYLPNAPHTDGDLYVYFPDDNVLAVGDAIYGEGWPFVDWWTGGWIGGIAGGIERILSVMNDDTRVIPARGPVLGLAGVQQQFEMYNTIFGRLSGMLNDGYGPDEAVAAKPTAEYDAAMGPPDAFVRQSFESLWAYLSPDA